jgi:hypothetical protein
MYRFFKGAHMLLQKRDILNLIFDQAKTLAKAPETEF